MCDSRAGRYALDSPVRAGPVPLPGNWFRFDLDFRSLARTVGTERHAEDDPDGDDDLGF
jgi:hypothetical protein